MPTKALLFDFDGVILDSLNVKTQAFYDMYLPYGKDIAEKAAQHHLEHGGVSRYEKFKIYHDRFLNQQIDEDQVQHLAGEFSDKVMQGVINSPEIEGIRDFLESAKNKYQMWVITGTPTTEIKKICETTQFTQYFKALYGSPEKKDFWTKKILNEEKFEPKEVVFIGDATTDYDAAMKNDVHFVLREHEDNTIFFKDKDVVRISDFTNFTDILKQNF